MKLVNQETQSNGEVKSLLSLADDLHGERWANIMKTIMTFSPIEFSIFDRYIKPEFCETQEDLVDSLGTYTFKYENGDFYGKVFTPWVRMDLHPKLFDWQKLSVLELSGILVEARLVEEYDQTLYQACLDAIKHK